LSPSIRACPEKFHIVPFRFNVNSTSLFDARIVEKNCPKSRQHLEIPVPIQYN
jgi:hypothetical protein